MVISKVKKTWENNRRKSWAHDNRCFTLPSGGSDGATTYGPTNNDVDVAVVVSVIALYYLFYTVRHTQRPPTQTHAYKNNKTFFVVGCVIYKTQCGSDTVECEFAAENVINDSPEVANEVSEEEEVFNSTYVSCVVLYCTTYKRGKSELARNSSNKAEA